MFLNKSFVCWIIIWIVYMKSVDSKYPNWYKVKMPMKLRDKVSKFVEDQIPEIVDFKYKKNGQKKKIEKKPLGFNIDAHFIVKRTETSCFFKIVIRNYNNILFIDLNKTEYSHHFYDKLLNCIEVIPCFQCGEDSNCDWNGRTPCMKTGLEKCSCVNTKRKCYLSLNECQILESQCYEYIDSIKDLVPLRKPYKIEKQIKTNGNDYYWLIKKIRSSKVKLCKSDSYYVFVRISKLPKELIKMISIFL